MLSGIYGKASENEGAEGLYEGTCLAYWVSRSIKYLTVILGSGPTKKNTVRAKQGGSEKIKTAICVRKKFNERKRRYLMG